MKLPVCILAGGLGTRLGAHVDSTPKPMVELAGAPFLHHQLDLLARHGVRRVVLCVGHLGEIVERSIGDGSAFDLSVSYAYDPPGLAGTAGAVRGALPQLGEAFLVLNGDTHLEIDYADFAETFLLRKLPGQMAVLNNEGRWGPSNAKFDGNLVVRFDKRNPDPSMSWIDAGLVGFRAEVFAGPAGTESPDLAEVCAELSSKGKLGGYVAEQRFYDIGTPDSLAEADRFLRSRQKQT